MDNLIISKESVESNGFADGDNVTLTVTGPIKVLPDGSGIVQCECTGETETEEETTETPEEETDTEETVSPMVTAVLGKKK